MDWVVVCFLTVGWALTIAIAEPQASNNGRMLFTEPIKDAPGSEKNYTGVRVSLKSQLLLYYHEQTIAVVELGNGRTLLSCELLEVKTAKDRNAAMMGFRISKKKIIRIGFKDMLDLMGKCQEIPAPDTVTNIQDSQTNPTYFTQQIFMGIFPGMKWCGRGDIASNYYDLGKESITDKCCRTHDLCPVKVGGYVTQYNITNDSMVTRSHCNCDENFYKCLKNTKRSVSDLIGNFYFNIGRLSCVIEEINLNNNVKFKFKTQNLRY